MLVVPCVIVVLKKRMGGGGGGLKSYAAWQERKVVWVAVNLGNMAVISQ